MSTVKVVQEPASWTSSFSNEPSPVSNVIHEKNDLPSISEESIYLILFIGSIIYFLYTFLKSKT